MTCKAVQTYANHIPMRLNLRRNQEFWEHVTVAQYLNNVINIQT